jgi:predicted GNAT family acetyltransferase
MLETRRYFGINNGEELISIASIHVYSEQYRVSALGNITTLPAQRGKGYGTTVTARLCQELLKTIDHIGLNVKADNKTAIRCYQRLGFEIIASYEEFMITRKFA